MRIPISNLELRTTLLVCHKSTPHRQRQPFDQVQVHISISDGHIKVASISYITGLIFRGEGKTDEKVNYVNVNASSTTTNTTFFGFPFPVQGFKIYNHPTPQSHTFYNRKKTTPQKVQSHCLFGNTIKHA